MPFKASELILNPDGSVYHLNLLPENVATTIILVGDPDRVDQVTQQFDVIEFKKRKREFHTQTGTYKNKRITVISTGIGTDNIDIVLNELDALVNIDFSKKDIKENLTSLEIVRIGTSGSIQKHIPVDSFVISKQAIGFDNLLTFYNTTGISLLDDVSESFVKHSNWSKDKSKPYVIECSNSLYERLQSGTTIDGFTGTNVGFYGPQGRILRLSIEDRDLNSKLATFKHDGLSITNLEMETSAIYGLSSLLNHKAVSMNAIIANRATGEFSNNPKETIKRLIRYTLDKLTEN
ncbi:nucleoside phosphorylase [Mangrovimonas sp. YM274]|uniref:nucleoside phosphorylase n=1 Tax=Mangrovimonas sp. YM274 TaxID=3070660 RepID=UPI0027DE5596|nr:nucleoside phosphorylase [Mangrovimonas sp. YM274]WMI67367.1 nucleoside phosphorylase [Mangrovimonas sp. YM274]